MRYSIDHPDVYIESNLIGFYNILEACRNNPVEHLVYASSSSVYGGNKKVPFVVEDAAIWEKRDFSFETVLSSEYKMDIIKLAKQEGYFIKCIFILTVDPLINVARVETRVALGGHDVPRDMIITRYTKSLAHIKDLIDLCDILHNHYSCWQVNRLKETIKRAEYHFR